MHHKVLTVFFILVIALLQIYTPAYANKTQDDALISAVLKGNIDEAKRLLADGAKVDAVNRFGVQAINIAIDIDNIAMVKALLAAGAKVGAISKSGYQPIHGAAQRGNAELVKILLAAGAKVDAKTVISKARIAGISSSGEVETVGVQPLHLAAQSGNAVLVKILLSAGAKVDAADNKGNTPFSYIFTQGKGDPELVKKVLLAAGAKKASNRIDDVKPIWLVTTTPQIKLGVHDKIGAKQSYIVKYTVKCEVGGAYVAEKSVTAEEAASSDVIFPDDFHDAAKGLQSHQAYGCGYGKQGQKSTWAIYVDDVLIDSGTMTFTTKLPN